MAFSTRQQKNKSLSGQRSVDDAVKAICDIMRRGNVTSAVYYVPELTWILFLRVLDEIEENDAVEAEAVGAEHRPSLAAPYRWRDWAAPDGAHRKILAEDGHAGGFFAFVNDDLLPYLEGPGRAS